ncbi:unnamed protein product, partial [Sphacelaria rigidula]
STSSRSYAVYFSTLPVHLWDRGRRRGDGATGQDSHASLATPARRVGHAWSQVAFVPGQEGEVVFVQGWSPRVLLTKLPQEQGGAGGARNMDSSRQLSMSSSSSIGFLDGSRVAALNGHESQA